MQKNLVETIKDLIYPYQYKAGVLLRDDVTLNYNPSLHQLSIDPFYQFSMHPREGSCTELMQTAYEEIRGVFPNLWVYRIIGGEPNFFPRGRHCYLLVAEKDLMGGKQFAQSPKDIAPVIHGNPLLVDPSFKTVMQLLSTKYMLGQVLNHGFPIIHPDNQLIQEGMDYPIYYSNGTLVMLSQSRSYQSILSIGFQKRGEHTKYYDLNSQDLTQRAKANAPLFELIAALRNKTIISSSAQLEYTSSSTLI